jgi:glycosyltransferase involved in cell wall biosynthesis
VDTGVFNIGPEHFPEKKKTVLFVGPYTWKKGATFIAPLAAAILKKDAGLSLLLVGLGLTEKQRAVIFAGMDCSRTDFNDRVKTGKMAEFFRTSAVLVHTSLFEGGVPSLTILEAMASGVPVLSFSYPGISGFIKDRENGFLFPIGDIEGMAEQAIALLTPVPERAAILKAGAVLVREFAWGLQVRKWESLIEEVCPCPRP